MFRRSLTIQDGSFTATVLELTIADFHSLLCAMDEIEIATTQDIIDYLLINKADGLARVNQCVIHDKPLNKTTIDQQTAMIDAFKLVNPALFKESPESKRNRQLIERGVRKPEKPVKASKIAADTERGIMALIMNGHAQAQSYSHSFYELSIKTLKEIQDKQNG